MLLKEENKKDVLEFKINQNLTMQIDLNSKDQTYLRELFYHIISQAFVEDFEFSLSVEQNYKKNLYIEISQEYIKQLNLELKKRITHFLKPLQKSTD